MKASGLCFALAASLMIVAARVSAQEIPQVKKQVNPEYPADLMKAGIEGEVFLSVTIDEKGQVQKVEALKTSDQRFVPAATDAVRKWEFAPATKDGVPVKSEVAIPFRFRLKTDSHKSSQVAIPKLQEDALRILRGELTDDLKSLIHVEAYVTINGIYEPLLPLLANKKSLLLVEGRGTEIEFSHLRTDATEGAAYLSLKTRPTEGAGPWFHTIVFMKGDGGKWKIVAWHASH